MPHISKYFFYSFFCWRVSVSSTTLSFWLGVLKHWSSYVTCAYWFWYIGIKIKIWEDWFIWNHIPRILRSLHTAFQCRTLDFQSPSVRLCTILIMQNLIHVILIVGFWNANAVLNVNFLECSWCWPIFICLWEIHNSCFENGLSPAFHYFLIELVRFSSAQQRGDSALPSS